MIFLLAKLIALSTNTRSASPVYYNDKTKTIRRLADNKLAKKLLFLIYTYYINDDYNSNNNKSNN